MKWVFISLFFTVALLAGNQDNSEFTKYKANKCLKGHEVLAFYLDQ